MKKLLLLSFILICSCSARIVHLPRLQVHKENPRWFDYDGKTVALFGSGDWGIIPNLNIDIVEHNEWYNSYGANTNRVTLFAFCTVVGLAPWKRTGPGTARDGLAKFDLREWDDDFWMRVHEYLSDCQKRKIIVLLQMWDEPFIEQSKERWGINPFNPANNINNIPGLPTGYGSAEKEFYDPDNEELTRFQDALIRKLLDETALVYGNIIYEIGNEINMDSRTPKDIAWQRHWIDFFEKYEQEHGIELLLSNDTRRVLFNDSSNAFDITNHHGFAGYNIRQSNKVQLSEQIYSAVQNDFKNYGKPVVNSRPCSDPDRKNYPDIVSEDIGRLLYWSYFCSGAHIIGFRTTEESWKGGLAAERIIQSVQTFIKRLKLERFVPRRDLVDNGLCLADTGREYVIYLAEGGTVTIDMSEVRGNMIATWYNPRKSTDERVEKIQAGSKLTFRAPDNNDWVLHCVKKK